MNHWQMIAIAYGLTVAVIALEIVMLRRRRQAALRHARIGEAAEEREDR